MREAATIGHLGGEMELILILLALIGGAASIWQIYEWVKRWRDNRIDNFASIERHGIRLLDQIVGSGFQPQLVVGIGRGGGFVGGWLAGNLGSVPFEVVERSHSRDSVNPVAFPHVETKMAYLRESYGESVTALIVEAATTRGTTLREFERLRLKHLPEWSCSYAVLFTNRAVDFPIAFSAKTLERTPDRYPWHYSTAYRHHVARQRDMEHSR